MRNVTEAKPRLTRQDWIDAALTQLTLAGIGSVRIEQLATSLGVTRGSFYHHFTAREDLLQAMLEYWAQRWTYEVRDQIAALDLEPATTLLALMKAIRKNRAAEFDAPFRAWALHDPMAQAVIEQVDRVRLDTIRSQFERLGFVGLDAECRARMFLYYEVAAPAIFPSLSSKQDERLLLERHRFLTKAPVVN